MRQLLWIVVVLAVLAAVNTVLPRLINPYIAQVVVLCGINVILAVSLNLVNGFTGQFSIGHAGFMALGAYGSAMFSMHVGTRWVATLAKRRLFPARPLRRRSPEWPVEGAEARQPPTRLPPLPQARRRRVLSPE